MVFASVVGTHARCFTTDLLYGCSKCKLNSKFLDRRRRDQRADRACFLFNRLSKSRLSPGSKCSLARPLTSGLPTADSEKTTPIPRAPVKARSTDSVAFHAPAKDSEKVGQPVHQHAQTRSRKPPAPPHERPFLQVSFVCRRCWLHGSFRSYQPQHREKCERRSCTCSLCAASDTKSFRVRALMLKAVVAESVTLAIPRLSQSRRRGPKPRPRRKDSQLHTPCNAVVAPGVGDSLLKMLSAPPVSAASPSHTPLLLREDADDPGVNTLVEALKSWAARTVAREPEVPSIRRVLELKLGVAKECSPQTTTETVAGEPDVIEVREQCPDPDRPAEESTFLSRQLGQELCSEAVSDQLVAEAADAAAAFERDLARDFVKDEVDDEKEDGAGRASCPSLSPQHPLPASEEPPFDCPRLSPQSGTQYETLVSVCLACDFVAETADLWATHRCNPSVSGAGAEGQEQDQLAAATTQPRPSRPRRQARRTLRGSERVARGDPACGVSRGGEQPEDLINVHPDTAPHHVDVDKYRESLLPTLHVNEDRRSGQDPLQLPDNAQENVHPSPLDTVIKAAPVPASAAPPVLHNATNSPTASVPAVRVIRRAVVQPLNYVHALGPPITTRADPFRSVESMVKPERMLDLAFGAPAKQDAAGAGSSLGTCFSCPECSRFSAVPRFRSRRGLAAHRLRHHLLAARGADQELPQLAALPRPCLLCPPPREGPRLLLEPAEHEAHARDVHGSVECTDLNDSRTNLENPVGFVPMDRLKYLVSLVEEINFTLVKSA